MTLPVIALSALLLLQTGKGSIQGTVVNAMTNKPIAGAQVNANLIGARPVSPVSGTGMTVFLGSGSVSEVQKGPVAVQIPAVTTDTSGHFVLSQLEPGSYLLRAAAEGYAHEDADSAQQAGQFGMTAHATVVAGESPRNIVFHLTPGGTVSGRLTGSNGEPLANIEVSLLRKNYSQEGRTIMNQVATAPTNDRGEYRLFWVTPGNYYLSAASSNRPTPGMPFRTDASNKYPRTFYPGTIDSEAASLVTVEPSGEISGMDFRLMEQQRYRVRGRVIDPSSRQIPRLVSIGITPRDPVVSGSSMSSSPYNPNDGTFELRDVPAGLYIIRGQLPLSSRPQPGQPMPVPPTAIALVNVQGSDVNGVVLTFMQPLSVPGRVRVEGGLPAISLNSLTATLRPATSGTIGSVPRPARVNADGNFTIEGVGAGDYRFQLSPLNLAASQGGLYLKSAFLAGVNVVGNPFTIAGPLNGGLDIVLSTNVGALSGMVRSSKPDLGGIQVVAVPDQRARYDLYKLARTDPAGHFAFATLSSGSYKIFAFENIETFSWMDPNVLRNYEGQGVAMTVGNGSDLTLDVRAISAIKH